MPRDGDRTRRRILRAAGDLLERTGFHALTMSDVADEAGLSRQAVYGHFASKAELVAAASDHLLEEATRRKGLPPLREDAPPREALEHAIAEYTRTVSEVYAVATANYLARGSDPAADAAWDHRSGTRRERYRRIFAGLAGEGALAADWTPHEAAEVLFALLSVRSYEMLVVEAGWPVERYEERVRRLVHGALLTPTAATAPRTG